MSTQLFIELVRIIGVWYDSIDLRRFRENSYRAVQVNRLSKAIMTALEHQNIVD